MPESASLAALPPPTWSPEGDISPPDTGVLASASASGGPFEFADFLDIINPLQHIPIVSSIYRAITGDRIGLPARLIGGALFGGPLGVIAAGASMAIEEVTGTSLGTEVVAALDDVGRALSGGKAPVAVAAAAEPAPPTEPPPKAAPHSTAAAPGPTAAATKEDAADARIAARIRAAERAQAALLFASLGLPAQAPKEDRADGHGKPDPEAAPVHPYLPSATPGPGYAAEAMRRALDQYRGVHSRLPARAPGVDIES